MVAPGKAGVGMGWWEKAEIVEEEEAGEPGTPRMLAILMVLAIPAWWGMVKFLSGLFW